MFGYVSRSSLTQAEIECSINLGFISSLRGVDSTGVAAVYKKGGKKYYQIAKAVLSSPDFFSTRNRSVAEHNENRSLIGHCRAATVGAVTFDNAHPFHEGDLIGCHNGTIHSLRDYKTERTDSQELYSRISKVGAEEAIQSVTGTKAYALTWIDLTDCSTFILRNNDRPLHYVKTKGGVLYWASEALFLRFAIARSGVIMDGEIEQFDVDKLYRFPFSDIVPEVTTIKTTKSYVVTPRKESGQAKSAVPFFPGQHQTTAATQARSLGFPFCLGSDTSTSSGADDTGEKTTEANTKHEEKKADPPKSKTHSGNTNTLYVGRHGLIVTREEYLKSIEDGCCCCQRDIKEEESYFLFDDSDNAVCEECVKEHNMEHMVVECGPYIPRYN